MGGAGHGFGHAGEGVGALWGEGFGVGDVVGGEFEGAGVEGGEEGFGEGEFGHFCGFLGGCFGGWVLRAEVGWSGGFGGYQGLLKLVWALSGRAGYLIALGFKGAVLLLTSRVKIVLDCASLLSLCDRCNSKPMLLDH